MVLSAATFVKVDTLASSDFQSVDLDIIPAFST